MQQKSQNQSQYVEYSVRLQIHLADPDLLHMSLEPATPHWSGRHYKPVCQSNGEPSWNLLYQP